MKKIFTLFLLLPLMCIAQPNGYYKAALGLNGTALQDSLHNIIDNHTSVGYAALWAHYQQTDVKPNGKVWDIYSDKPGQIPPYEYSFITDQCGNYSSEGDCYNREHSFPQSYFNGAEPMYSDLFQVYPTDGYVNGKRGNLMYGVVSNPNYVSMNGSEVGANVYPGSAAGNAFEPIDSFKGDIARTYFYIATRYKGEDNGWSNWEMANGATLKQWAINMLLEWHHNDPVSKKEKDRNDAVYNIQNNRNPFIDYPVFADCIWGTADCSTLPVSEVMNDLWLNIFPNPAAERINIRWQNPDDIRAIDVLNTTGERLYHQDLSEERTVSISVDNWPKGVYFIYLKGSKNSRAQKLIVQ